MQLQALLPQYRATRKLLEATFESLPQSVLQLYVYLALWLRPPPAAAAPGPSLHTSVPLIATSLALSLLSLGWAWLEFAWLAPHPPLSRAPQSILTLHISAC